MLGEAFALGSALVWSFSVILFKRSEAISPQGMNLFKNLVGMVLLAFTLLVLGLRPDMDRPLLEWGQLALSGLLGICVADTLFFMALRVLGPGRLAVVECVYAPSIVLLSVLFLSEPVGAWLLVGGAMVVGGVALANAEGLSTVGELSDDAAAGKRALRKGVALGLLGMLSMAFGVILAKGPLADGELLEIVWVRLTAGVLGQLIWIAAAPSQRPALKVLRPQLAWRTLLPAAILSSYISMILWLGGFKYANASTAAVLNQMATVFTIVLARVFLGEPIRPRRAVGAALAIAGVLLVLLPGAAEPVDEPSIVEGNR
jgi:drug/metabolite transporter (DMT)-like permease